MPSDTAQANKAVIRRLYGEAMANGRIEVAEELYAPDYRDHMGILPEPTREAMIASIVATREAFPDVVPEIRDIIAEGDKVAIPVEARGTHTGPFLGIAPTHRPVRWTETHLFRLADGRIAEHWGDVSLLGTLQQIGAVPGMDALA